MNFAAIARKLKEHSPVILSSMAAAGTLLTAYLAGRASFEAADVIRELDKPEDPKARFKEEFKHVWKLYIPTAVSAGTTIFCIVAANRSEVRKTLAAQAAFALSERAYSQYRDKVVEEYGESKDQAIRDKIAEERVRRTAPAEGLVVGGSGTVLCCEAFTGRYFMSDMETLRRAQNDLNAKLLSHDGASFDDFYWLIGLKPTAYSGNMGWNTPKQMELQFSTVMTEDGRPCLVFDYNYYEPF